MRVPRLPSIISALSYIIPKRKASSQLSEAGLALMRRRGVLDGGVVPGGCRLGTLFEAKDVAGSGAGVMAGSKAGSAKCAARERRTHRHVSLKRLVSPLFSATRGASRMAGASSRTSVTPRVLTVLYCGPTRWLPGQRRAPVNPETRRGSSCSASTTGAKQRASALEPGGYRHPYGPVRRRDATGM